MNPQTMQLLQMFGGIGGNDLDNSVAEMINAKAVETRTAAAVKAQEASITDPKMVKYIFTGKYE